MVNEKRMIYKEDLLETILGHFGIDLAYLGSDLQFCQEAIENAPTVDAVEVVRCKDCRYCEPERHYCDHPMSTSVPIPRKSDGFCSYGERKCNG